MNTEPLFKLYVNSKDKYEVVPTGYSLGAFLFQIIWAFWNGVVEKYLFLQIPIVLIFWLEEIASDEFDIVVFVMLIAYSFFANALYFPKLANSWREKALKREGYKLVLETRAVNADRVIEIYADQYCDS